MSTLDIMGGLRDRQEDGQDGGEPQTALRSHLEIRSQLTGLPSPPSTVCPGLETLSRSGGSDDERQLELQDSDAQSSQEDLTDPKPYPLPPPNGTKEVLPEDINTPDCHVPRDPRLIRLTGIHPFNAEAPLSSLYDEGFLTSEDLHFVRNHGPVPQCDDAGVLDWEFTIEGMVENPIRMTLKDLLADYDQITYPITIVCAGNRRKEQNMVRKSKGFSWGPAGLSTALWTGVPIGEILARARPKRGARYVCFEGADKLPNGYYGTSVKLNWCMDVNRGILVAHKMNGDVLHPDHGKPLRIVVPGQIGGRSVKWLRRIIVTADPSDNWYHIYDNRVLPTDITPEASADLPEVWKDEKYAIYDLNANSAICYPAHGETVDIKSSSPTYTVRGYAYGGGGRRITRVEVTLDRGKSWSLAHLRYPEDDYRLSADGDSLYEGRVDMWWRETSFCWSFWEVDIPIDRLAEADDILVRAMDESLHVQPRDMYWSVLGMMNNNWFRVVIHKDHDGQGLSFEHPTQPALIPGGWMERIKNAGGDITNGFWGETIPGQTGSKIAPMKHEPKQISMINPKVKRTINLRELKDHSGKEEPWFVVDGEVYDGTPFLDAHPGGPVSIFGAAGLDASEEFITVHSENAKAMMPDYHIGTLDDVSRIALAGEDSVLPRDPFRSVFLQPKTWSRAILADKQRISPDSFFFTFKLDHENQQLGVPVGQHFLMRLRDPATREVIIRAYTPASDVTEKGKLRILIKVYYDTPDRPGGKMTQALDSLPKGHYIDVKGPVGKFEYMGLGKCIIGGQKLQIRRLVMICGGSGITPFYQILRAIVNNSEDPTECLVLYGNRTEQDILCRTELDTIAEEHKDRFRVVYSLTDPPESWPGKRGRLDKAMIAREVGVPRYGDGELALIAGPEGMEVAAEAALLVLQWAQHNVIIF